MFPADAPAKVLPFRVHRGGRAGRGAALKVSPFMKKIARLERERPIAAEVLERIVDNALRDGPQYVDAG